MRFIAHHSIKKNSFLNLTFGIILLISTSPSIAQTGLPKCQGADPTKWSNCEGAETSTDGSKYTGAYRNGQFNGQGTFLFLANNQFKGDKYIGEFQNGTFHGYGSYIYATGYTYVGRWKDGLPNGRGTKSYAEGKYEGEWKDGKRHGQGTETLVDGSKYVGEWKDGRRSGQGTLFASNGSITSQGRWVDGSPPKQQAQTKNSETEMELKHLGACSGYHYSFALAAKNSNKINGYKNSLSIAERLDAKYGSNADYNGAKTRVMNHIGSLVQKNDPNLSTALVSYSNSCTQNGIAIGQWN